MEEEEEGDYGGYGGYGDFDDLIDDDGQEVEEGEDSGEMLAGSEVEGEASETGSGAGGAGGEGPSKGEEDVGSSMMFRYTVSERLDMAGKREVGRHAVWSLSTTKPGNGVEQIRDDDMETYWQSDGTQPHLVNIQFMRSTLVSDVAMYLSFEQDESYTPKKLTIKAGTNMHDLVDVTVVDLGEPRGWVVIPVRSAASARAVALGAANAVLGGGPLRAHLLQIRINGMHQNGRDTHVRQIKVLSPRVSQPVMGGIPFNAFATAEMRQFASIR